MKLVLITFILGCLTASADTVLFDSNETLELELTYDINKLQIEKEDLRLKGLSGKLITTTDRKEFPVEVLSRGAGSFDCKQPQLKIKFNKKDNKNTIFESLKKVKLFTKGLCLDNKTSVEQDRNILANYLNYKLYEEFTLAHYKTRLVKINYIDSSGTYKPYTQLAFFLEPKNSLEKRLELKYIEKMDLPTLKEEIKLHTDYKQSAIVHAFEFFIANYDYGIPGQFSHIINDSGYGEINFFEKNSKMFVDRSGSYIPFIYDFDISRFGYWGDFCFVGFPFFNHNYPMPPSCNSQGLEAMLVNDLAKFKFQQDVRDHSSYLVNAFRAWRTQYAEEIEYLGTAYSSGFDAFIHAFIEVTK